MLMKDPQIRYQSLTDVKIHPWLSDVKWDEVLAKRWRSPPIVPNVRESQIDPDYTDLPLDFEENKDFDRGSRINGHNNRLSTDRRISYYYESTLQSKIYPSEQNLLNHHH